MKIFDIAFKDLSQSFRSLTALVFMLGVPILVTGMFYIMFGGMKNTKEINLPQTVVQVANLDEGSPLFSQGMAASLPEQSGQGGIDYSNVKSMGDVIVMILQSQSFAKIMAVSLAPDAASARAAVDDQKAGVAIIIPVNFSAALIQSSEQATLDLYQDPTLTLGPEVVKAVMTQLMENLAGVKIGTAVIAEQLAKAGVVLDGPTQQAVAMQLLSASGSQTQEGNGIENPYLTIQAPQTEKQTSGNLFVKVISTVMAGMLVFYAFYTGAVTAQSILKEEERGTLPRLFTTPTLLSHILSGKFLAVALTVVVQVIILMLFGKLVFGVEWGALGVVALVIVGMVAASATMGIFIVAFLKNSRQAGAVYGGVLTVTGMLGISNIFTMSVPNPPQAINVISLLVPQGWAMHSLSAAMEAQPISRLLLYWGGTLLWSIVFFSIGILKLRRRFA